jgi:hypothetical protein
MSSAIRKKPGRLLAVGQHAKPYSLEGRKSLPTKQAYAFFNRV